MRPGPGRFLRRLASLLVRGPDAPFVLGDLEETLSRDLARGVWPRRARWRYLRNAVASASRLARARARGSWRGRRRGFGALGVSWLDVKLGLRMLVKAPLLTAVSIVSLGVGIPVGLAPGQIIDALETTLPVEGGDRIEILRYRSVETSGVVLPTSYDLGVWREALGSFETLAAVRLVEHNVDSGNDAAAPVVGAELTPSTFGILEARPLLGRMLDGGDAVPGAPPVVVLGEDLWRARMAGDSGAVGRTVRISGEPHTVVGIMPSDFGFPVRQQMWLPLEALPASEPGDGIRMQVFGRLAEGATREIAEGELATVLRRLGAELPETHRLLVAEVAPFTAAGWMGQPEGSLRGATTGIWLMQMPSLLLLMVACVNVGLLVFARAATRSEELAVRTALGASRGRIVAQVLAEALVLAVVSAGAGLLLLHLITTRYIETVVSVLGAYPPYYMDFGVTWQTVLRALLLAALSAAAAAVLPALRVTGKGLRLGLQRAGAGSRGIRFGRMSTALVVADIALAVAVVGLAVGVGNRVGGAVLRTAEPQLAVEEYLAARIRLPVSVAPFDVESAAAREARMARIERELVERLEADPRVRGVAVASSLPGMSYSRRHVETGTGVHPIDQGWVGLGFFEGLGRPVLAGRDFGPEDLEGDRRSVIVNVAFAEQVLPTSRMDRSSRRQARKSADRVSVTVVRVSTFRIRTMPSPPGYGILGNAASLITSNAPAAIAMPNARASAPTTVMPG